MRRWPKYTWHALGEIVKVWRARTSRCIYGNSLLKRSAQTRAWHKSTQQFVGVVSKSGRPPCSICALSLIPDQDSLSFFFSATRVKAPTQILMRRRTCTLRLNVKHPRKKYSAMPTGIGVGVRTKLRRVMSWLCLNCRCFCTTFNYAWTKRQWGQWPFLNTYCTR